MKRIIVRLKELDMPCSIRTSQSWSNTIVRLKGGSGSGNFSHTGRPGLVGGSGEGNDLINDMKFCKDVKVSNISNISEEHIWGFLYGDKSIYMDSNSPYGSFYTHPAWLRKVMDVRDSVNNTRGWKFARDNNMVRFMKHGDEAGINYVKGHISRDTRDGILALITKGIVKTLYVDVQDDESGNFKILDNKTDPFYREIMDYNVELKEHHIGIISLKGGAGSGNFSHRGRPGEVGGSSSEGTNHMEFSSNNPMVKDFIKYFKDREEEHCIVFNRDGKTILRADGTKDSLTIKQEYEKQMQDAIFIHNHPGNYILSNADIDAAIKLDSYQMVSLGADAWDGGYKISILTRPENGWPDRSDVNDYIKDISPDMFDEYTTRINDGMDKLASAGIYWTLLMKSITSKFNINYKEEII